MKIYSPLITGSISVNNVNVTNVTNVAGFATTSSVNTLIARTGSYATTGSNQFNGNQSISGSITSNGTITAQTLVVQTITSSVDFVTGSSVNGSLSSNTHQFTGSVLITGSATTLLSVNNNVLYVSSSGNVLIGATTGDNYKLQIVGANQATSTFGQTYAGVAAYSQWISSSGAFVMGLDGAAGTTPRITITGTGNVGIGTSPSYLLQTKDAGITVQNTYFGTGQVRVGGGSDHGANTVLSVAPGVVTFDRPGVGGGALTINSSGYVTFPAQPSFTAVSNADLQNYTSGQVIVFNLTRYNTSGNYNTSNGRFTAPVAGKYLFAVNVYTYTSFAVSITLTINGSQYVPSDVVPLIFKPSEGVSSNLSFTILLNLSANDYVELRARTDQAARIYMSHSHFSGHLIA